MKLRAIEGNSQSLDGGAMFGNAPKNLWSQWVKTDLHNRVELATRGLLVIFDDGLTVLFETGVGAFFPPRMRERYGINESEHVLLNSLAAEGIQHSDIDVVVLSHLHFDHAGGLLAPWAEEKPPELLFPQARFVVSEKHWERARQPHQRDKASFIPELVGLLEQSGRLELVARNQQEILDGKVKLHHSNGHTPGLMLSEIQTENGPLVFSADLIPGAPWVRTAITMGYDRFPELLIDEKKRLLDDLYSRQGRLFFTHDKDMCCAAIEQDEKGGFTVSRTDLN